MFILLIYNDPNQSSLCAYYKFSKIKDIIAFTNNLFRYSDVSASNSIYRTYKAHFRLVKVSSLEKYNYFSGVRRKLTYVKT